GRFPGISGVAALRDGAPQEAVVATAEGELIGVLIEDDLVRHVPLASFGSMADIAGMSIPGSGDDRLLLLAKADGMLYELRLEASRINLMRNLGALGAKRVAAFPGSSGECYGLVATREGSLLELRLGAGGPGAVLARFEDIQDVAGFESDDGLRHAIV